MLAASGGRAQALAYGRALVPRAGIGYLRAYQTHATGISWRFLGGVYAARACGVNGFDELPSPRALLVRWERSALSTAAFLPFTYPLPPAPFVVLRACPEEFVFGDPSSVVNSYARSINRDRAAGLPSRLV